MLIFLKKGDNIYLNKFWGNFMNSRQLYYAVQLSEVGSFSKLAEALNVSQPALSKQILSLEKELGVKLFKRANTFVSPTPAGVHFVREAKEILYKEDQLIKSMAQYKQGDKGELVIGVTPFRSSYLMPSLILVEEGSELLRHDAAEGKFDFAVVNLPVDDSVLEVTPLEPDRLVLVVPNTLCEKHNLKGKNISFAKCTSLPFVVVSATQEMRILFDRLCVSLSVNPKICAEVTGLVTALEIANSGVAATLLPKQFVNSRNQQDNLTLFELTDNTSLRQPAVVRKKGQFKSKYAEYAIELLEKQN